MNKENVLIKELENLSHDCQYLKEMKNIIQQDDFGLTKIYSSLKEMKALKLEIGDLDIKLKKIMEKIIKDEEQFIAAVEKKQQIHNQINSIEQPYRNILYFRYVCDKTFDQIAFKMNYSTKRIYQLHKEAIYIYCQKYK